MQFDKKQIEKIPEGCRTRFAPSPTGFLHLGHVLNMIYVWGIARARNGIVVSRMEDHDRGRYRPEYELAILQDMEWLGFIPDEGIRASDALKSSDFRQSDCIEKYEAELSRLKDFGLIYGCDCTRKQIKAQQPDSATELVYTGKCRDENRSLDDVTVRFKTPEDMTILFNDLRLGDCQQKPFEQCGDFSLRDRHGNWTYQFCCVCDDIRNRIDLVVRGEDIFPSTARQIMMINALGGNVPRYFHHNLLIDENGEKLSKRQFSESIRQMKENGATVEDIIGRAAFSGGLIPEFRPLSYNEAISIL